MATGRPRGTSEENKDKQVGRPCDKGKKPNASGIRWSRRDSKQDLIADSLEFDGDIPASAAEKLSSPGYGANKSVLFGGKKANSPDSKAATVTVADFDADDFPSLTRSSSNP